MQKEVSKFTNTIRKNTTDIIIFYDYAYPLNSINLYPERKFLVTPEDPQTRRLTFHFEGKGYKEFPFHRQSSFSDPTQFNNFW
jgi:hypothetical protein